MVVSRRLFCNAFGLFRVAVAIVCGDRLIADSPASDESVFFEAKVRPVLVKHCYECHSESADELQGGLRLDTRAGTRLGGDSGPAVTPGKPSKSLLLSAIRHSGLKMPPDEKLSDDVIADIEHWIKKGAPDPREGAATIAGPAFDLQQARKYWAFQPIRDHEIPTVQNVGWLQTAVDNFVLAKLESKGLQPASTADKFELCRRIYFDLHGLPPSPEQVDAFVHDESPDAYTRLVDQLLSSARYGERWGQHWLDLIRFAETEGFEYDRAIPGAWRFRDFVIQSFNEGKSVDKFIREQIAGDEIDKGDQQLLVAAGFHRLGAVRRNAGNQEVAGSRNEVLTERTDIIGSAILGLTIGCARCHNHKFDSISQADYYRLQAYFAASHEVDIPTVSENERNKWENETSEIQKQIDTLKTQLETQSDDEQKATRAKLELLDKALPTPLSSIGSIKNDFEKATPIHVLRRGEWSLPGDLVSAAPPAVFGVESLLSDEDRIHPRSALASWLIDPSNPLTPRVFANRVWQNHFGRGLVATPNDFGRNGQSPSHPELLDYLSAFLVRHEWQIKPLHRLIVLSNTYQQTSHPFSKGLGESMDPNNALLWHFTARRLSAEEIRDSMLTISGQMNYSVGGPSIMLPVDKELVAQLYKVSQWQVTLAQSERMRRSIYLLAKRNLRLPFMDVFDQPTLQSSCSRREQSTHAPQALELLNGPIANQMAEAFSDRLLRETNGDVESIVNLAFQWVTGRPVSNDERRIATSFLKENSPREFAIAMFNLNSFLYVR